MLKVYEKLKSEPLLKKRPKEKKQQSYEDQKKLKSLNNRLSNVEAQINQLESDIKKIDFELEINYEEVTSKPHFFDKYQKMKSDLKGFMEKWEEIQLEIEANEL